MLKPKKLINKKFLSSLDTSTEEIHHIIELANNFNVCFILIQNSNYKMLDTLRSRCYLFKVRISYKDTIKIVNNLQLVTWN